MSKSVAVIGSGLGGLSAAIDLRSRGFSVDLYEKNAYTGGKAGSLNVKGFTFDTGPSILTMPFVLEKIMKKAGYDLEERLPLIRLEKICKYFFTDGTELNAFSDTGKFVDELDSKTSDKRQDIEKFLSYCAAMYSNAKDLFLFNSLEALPETFRSRPWDLFKVILSLDIFRTLHASHKKFFKDPNTIQLFDRYATYSGSDPYKLPATLNIIPHVEYGLGVFVPRGGIRAIPAVLTDAVHKMGVAIYTEREVKKILLRGKTVTGIETRDGKREYDAVVSNCDVNTTYKELLSDKSSKRSVRYGKMEPSSSAIVFYWGIKGLHGQLEANNIIFSSDYSGEFRQIFNERKIPEDPTIYINITSKYCPMDAPEMSENWFVLVNVPYDKGQDWKNGTLKVKERVLRSIEKRIGSDISGKIVSEDVLTPPDISRNTLSNKGSIYGISSNSKMAAFYRQPNRSDIYKGLYFCGGSAHPGGGMPLVMLSGIITADLVEKHVS